MSRAPKPHGLTSASISLRHNTWRGGGQRYLEAIFAGVARARDEVRVDARRIERFQHVGCRPRFRQRVPHAGARVRSLHCDHREIPTRDKRCVRRPRRCHRFQPGEVFVGRAGVDDDAERVVAKQIDDQVVEDSAVGRQQTRVERFAVCPQSVDVVGQRIAQQRTRTRTLKIKGKHMGDIEHARIGPHRVMLADLRPVVDGHVPSGEIDHLRAHGAMDGVERSLIGQGVSQATKGREASAIRVVPSVLLPERLRHALCDQ